MSTTIDETKLNELLGRFVTDLGATIGAGSIRIGDQLGLYQALADAGPLTPAELASYTKTAERYVREWLPGQAASGNVSSETGEYWLTAEQVLAFADPGGPGIAGRVPIGIGLSAR
jgi:hypothetical protein